METKTIFRSSLVVVVFAVIFCGIGYGAYAFNETNAVIAFSSLIAPLLIIIFSYILKNIIVSKWPKTTQILRKIFSLPLFILAIIPGIALIWIVGAASIHFGLPFIKDPFLAGITTFIFLVIGFLIYLRIVKSN